MWPGGVDAVWWLGLGFVYSFWLPEFGVGQDVVPGGGMCWCVVLLGVVDVVWWLGLGFVRGIWTDDGNWWWFGNLRGRCCYLLAIVAVVWGFGLARMLCLAVATLGMSCCLVVWMRCGGLFLAWRGAPGGLDSGASGGWRWFGAWVVVGVTGCMVIVLLL